MPKMIQVLFWKDLSEKHEFSTSLNQSRVHPSYGLLVSVTWVGFGIGWADTHVKEDFTLVLRFANAHEQSVDFEIYQIESCIFQILIIISCLFLISSHRSNLLVHFFCFSSIKCNFWSNRFGFLNDKHIVNKQQFQKRTRFILNQLFPLWFWFKMFNKIL